MPYKDLERKREWERLHRSERLARRRELRRIATTRPRTRPKASGTEHNIAGFLIPLVAGGALAAYSPKLGMAAGSGTLIVAAMFKKGWAWWVLGAVLLALAIFFYWNKQNTQDSEPDKPNGDEQGRAETEQP
jgi:hypothetical protein